jgi:thiosulfate/3-mercaptopyruvate sulfurtransferase
LTTVDTARVNAWRVFFAAPAVPAAPAVSVEVGIFTSPEDAAMPRVVETDWLEARLGTPGLKVIDLRPQPEDNHAHIPGSLSLNVESVRGNIGGVPSMLLPAGMLAAQFSLLGLQPSDTVVLVSGDKLYDTTLAGMAFERLGHMDYAVLNGGYAKWAEEGRPADAALPAVTGSTYPPTVDADAFTVGFQTVAARLGKPGVVIIDVRPADFYSGQKSDEARAGHIPGAISRPFTEDVITRSNKVVSFKPAGTLAAAYSRIIPSKDTEVIVHCRTGHQASQTFFVLKRLLGYTNVRWYDAGWTEWAAHSELPIVNEAQALKSKK